MNSLNSSVATLERDGPIAILVVNYPPVNALGQEVRDALADALATVAKDDAIAALVIRCDARTYFAGADIREFGKPRTPPYLPELFTQVESSTKPVITAIHGNALGGGLELAMACHFRLATRASMLGVPEVTLGILPGAGGTQRLPRLIGTSQALDLLTSGRSIGAPEALDLGLIDAIIDGDVAEQAVAFARAVISEGRAVRRTRDRDEKLIDVRADPAMIDRFETENAAKFRNLDAPPAIFTAIRGILCTDFDEGVAIERRLFLALRDGPQAAALRHSFFAEREAGKLPSAPASARPQPIDTIGLVGSGPTARDFAADFLKAGCAVRLVSVRSDAADLSVRSIHERIDQDIATGRMSQANADRAKSLLHPVSTFEALSDVDLIVEATNASAAEKQDMFERLDGVVKPAALLAAITSSPDIDEIGTTMKRREGLVGIHVLPQPGTAQLIELVRGEKTTDMMLASVMALMKRIGKSAVVLGNGRGFIGERMLAVQRREANVMVTQGVHPEDINRVAEAFGMAMGPFRACERAGKDFGRAETRDAGNRLIDDPEILARLHYPLINEGARLLEEGGALRASDIDVVWLKAYGWPAWTGGPMFHGDRIGLSALVGALDRLEVKPAALLVRLADQKKSFADFDAKAA